MQVEQSTCAVAYAPSCAIMPDLPPAAIHGTAFAPLALAHNLSELAPGPFVTGVLVDYTGPAGAFRLLPPVSLVSAVGFLDQRRHSAADAARMAGERA